MVDDPRSSCNSPTRPCWKCSHRSQKTSHSRPPLRPTTMHGFGRGCQGCCCGSGCSAERPRDCPPRSSAGSGANSGSSPNGSRRLMGIDRAIGAWTGPDNSVHDFQTPNGSIEVKTSAAHEPQIVRINGERQLDDTAVPALYLLHLSIEVRHRTGSTLDDAIAAARGLAAVVQLPSCSKTDCSPTAISTLTPTSTGTLDTSCARPNSSPSTDGFPRIVESDLADGIGRVHYDLAIAACADHRTDMDRTLATLAGV